jgi:hypothetical protein
VTQCDSGVVLMAVAEGTTSADKRGVVTVDEMDKRQQWDGLEALAADERE